MAYLMFITVFAYNARLIIRSLKWLYVCGYMYVATKFDMKLKLRILFKDFILNTSLLNAV